MCWGFFWWKCFVCIWGTVCQSEKSSSATELKSHENCTLCSLALCNLKSINCRRYLTGSIFVLFSWWWSHECQLLVYPSLFSQAKPRRGKIIIVIRLSIINRLFQLRGKSVSTSLLIFLTISHICRYRKYWWVLEGAVHLPPPWYDSYIWGHLRSYLTSPKPTFWNFNLWSSLYVSIELTLQARHS